MCGRVLPATTAGTSFGRCRRLEILVSSSGRRYRLTVALLMAKIESTTAADGAAARCFQHFAAPWVGKHSAVGRAEAAQLPKPVIAGNVVASTVCRVGFPIPIQIQARADVVVSKHEVQINAPAGARARPLPAYRQFTSSSPHKHLFHSTCFSILLQCGESLEITFHPP